MSTVSLEGAIVDTTHRRFRRPVLAIAAALTAMAAALVGTPTATAQPTPSASSAAIAWDGPCDYSQRLDCGTITVPLDYSDPTGEQIQIHVERLPANGDPAERLGSILTNHGGPGVTGTNFAGTFERRLGPEVRAQYDIISFSPRGIGLAEPQIHCFTTAEERNAVRGQFNDFPLTRRDMAATLAGSIGYAKACALNGHPFVRHMGTINVARDLDQIRSALGDDQLNYVGLSYGTHIGAVYANLYPDRVGHMVLDGPVDPAGRTGDRLASKLASAQGVEAVMNNFLTACAEAGPQLCALAAGDISPAEKWQTIHTELRERDAVLPSGATVTLASLVTSTKNTLNYRSDYRALAQRLELIHQALTQPTTPSLDTPQRRSVTEEPGLPYYQLDGLYAVNCADTDRNLPTGVDEYAALAEEWDTIAGSFGRYWLFNQAACAWWPEPAERYTGPWDTPTANTVLVVGNENDPATPYPAAIAMTEQLADARLLTVGGFGHTSKDSICAQQNIADYLLTGTLPAPDTWCEQDLGPFDAA